MTEFEHIITRSVAAIESLRATEPTLMRIVDRVADCLRDGHKLLICGNGGSAADASHLATEFVVRFVKDRRPFAAIALADSGSTLTAGGNDYGFDDVFARQVWALGQRGDVVVVFSTSGQSRNIVTALQKATEMGLSSISFLGKDGGQASGLAAEQIIVPSDDTARIQEAHGVLIHALCELVEDRLVGP